MCIHVTSYVVCGGYSVTFVGAQLKDRFHQWQWRHQKSNTNYAVLGFSAFPHKYEHRTVGRASAVLLGNTESDCLELQAEIQVA